MDSGIHILRLGIVYSSNRELHEIHTDVLALVLTGCAFPHAGQITISVSSTGAGAGFGAEAPGVGPWDFPLRVKEALHPGQVTFRGRSWEVMGILHLHLGQVFTSYNK